MTGNKIGDKDILDILFDIAFMHPGKNMTFVLKSQYVLESSGKNIEFQAIGGNDFEPDQVEISESVQAQRNAVIFEKFTGKQNVSNIWLERLNLNCVQTSKEDLAIIQDYSKGNQQKMDIMTKEILAIRDQTSERRNQAVASAAAMQKSKSVVSKSSDNKLSDEQMQ